MNKLAVMLVAASLATPPALAGQNDTPAQGPAPVYMVRYNELAHLAASGQSADVNHLVIARDAGSLVLERGKLYALNQVGGRLVGVAFRGEGRFTFAPPNATERAQLQQFASATTMDDPITGAVLLFADSTPAQLHALAFAAGDVPGNVRDDVNELIGSLKGTRDGSFNSAVMGPMLNGDADGTFMAEVTRAQGPKVLYLINPSVSESVRLYRPVSRNRWGSPWAVVTQFPPRTAESGTEGAWEERDRLRIPAYTMDVTLNEAFNANLGFTGSATMTLAAQEAVGPWLRFTLEPVLGLDSAKWGTGGPAAFFKASESYDTWVRAPRAMRPGDTLSLTLYYHGDLIDRVGNFFFVDPEASWYPGNGQGRTLATFDLTFHSPFQYPLVATGELRDSARVAQVRNTHWVISRPSSFASFNLGLFQPLHVEYADAPPLDVYISDEAHSLLRRQYAAMGYDVPEQAHMRENVAVDVSNSLKMFTTMFGPSPFGHFTVTEIPFGEGVSFPGMIDLSWGTFQNTELGGFDEFFRAHEAAHQWWGNGVRPGSYRDAWLSEGLASFCGIWYVELLKRRDTEYYRFLDQYKHDIDAVRGAGPIWLGYRASTPDQARGYDVIIYEKGAWVFHMLRSIFTDLNTLHSDRFADMMKDYYTTFAGRPATTEDFRGIVEKHLNADMGWFFDEWVRNTAQPTYRVAWRTEPTDDGKFRVHLRVNQQNVPVDFQMPVLVAVDLGNQRTARFRIMVNGTQTDYTSPLIPLEPKDLVFNDMHSVLADVHMERW